MPAIIATPYPALGRVLVEVTWDVSGATCTQVRRVITATGQSAPLRGYVWPCSELGEFQHLSGGYAAFWDTEPPLDQAFTYESVATHPDGSLIGESTSPSGLQTWTVGPGYATTPDNAALDITGDIDIRVDVSLVSWSMGSYQALVTKWLDATNQRSYRLTTTATGGLLFQSSSAGTAGTITSEESTASVPVAPGQRVAVRAIVDADDGAGNHIVYFYYGPSINGPWTIVGTPKQNAGVISIFNGTAAMEVGVDLGDAVTAQGIFHAVEVVNGGTNVQVANPMFFQQTPGTTSFVDAAGRTWSVVAPGAIVGPSEATVITSDSITLESSGTFWLRDPVRPCNDQQILLCFDTADVACAAGNGIFFAEMDAEDYASNTFLNLPTNARRPIATSRTRRDVDSRLTLVTRTFADRDALLNINEPGSPLQFVAPSQYGIPDRYMSVQEVSVARGVSDHRFQPRVIQMPFVAVDRPVGPTQGVCGARVEDLCDTYPTWDDFVASGLAWSTLLEGTAAELGFRTWGGVNSDFADWAAVLANGTWEDARELP